MTKLKMQWSKRNLAAQLSWTSGVTNLLLRLRSLPLLLVFNYHRIGNPDENPYDPGTFSATRDVLNAQE